MSEFKLKKWWGFAGTILIIIVAVFFRVTSYQDALSIGTSDTLSYIQAGNISLFSKNFFTAQRPFPISLVYKFLQPSDGYQLIHINKAWIGTDKDRTIQPGLDRISLAQSLFSIFSWSMLVIIFSIYIKDPVIKMISAILIYAFAFSPQLADWDGVLMSESFSFSLFALFLAFSILLAQNLWQTAGEKKGILNILISIVWFIIITLWMFIRDSNAYGVLIVIFSLLCILLIPKLNRQIDRKHIIILALSLLAVFFLHGVSLRASDRWVNPLFNNLLKNILPIQEHVDFMVEKGMPVTDEMYALLDSPGNELAFFEMDELLNWAETEGYSVYTQFLVTHPVWTVEKLVDNLGLIFISNRQPYYHGTPESTPLWMLPLGDKLHIRSPWIILLDLSLTLAIIIAAWKNRALRVSSGWAWLAGWLFIVEITILFVSYHGDALGIERHTLAAVMPLRLSVWILSCILFDIILLKRKQEIRL